MRDLFGGRFSHAADCFENLATQGPEPSKFLDAIEVNDNQLSGALNGQFTDALRFAGNAGIKFENRTQIIFNSVNAFTASDVALRRAFSEPHFCPEIERIINGNSDPEGVLLIGTVFYAKPGIVVTRRKSLSGNTEVDGNPDEVFGKWQSLLDAAGLSLDVELGGGLDGSLSSVRDIRLGSENSLPVAYLPAFISLRHLSQMIDMISRAQVTSFESNLKAFATNEITESEAAERMAPVFREAALPTDSDGFFRSMSTGKMVNFDIENETHQEYIRRVGLFLAAIEELSVLATE